MLICLFLQAAFAVSVTSFTAGAPISASVMNTNFSNVVSAVNTLPWSVSGGLLSTTYTATGINNASPAATLDIGSSNAACCGTSSSFVPAMRVTNSSSTGQSFIDFYTGTTAWQGRIRSDYVGNFYFAAHGGSSVLQVGGDSGFGATYSLGLTPTGVFQHSTGWYINANGTSNISSDARMKEDVRPVSNALSRLLQVRGVEFKWKQGLPDAGKRSLGVIAQEVEKVFPELVSEDKERKTVAYTPLIAPVIEAIRELAAQVKELTSKNSAMMSEMQELMEQNRSLQKRLDAYSK